MPTTPTPKPLPVEPPEASVETTTTTMTPAPTSDRWVVRAVIGVLAVVVIGNLVALDVFLLTTGDVDARKVALAALIHLADIALGGVIGFLVSAKSQAS